MIELCKKEGIIIDKEAIGHRIKSIRLRLGLTMEDFIEKIDGKPGHGRSGTVNNWETGKNAPSKKRLRKIADMAGVSVNYLLYGNFKNRIDKVAQYAQLIWDHRDDESDNNVDNIIPLDQEYLNALKELVGIINSDEYCGKVGTRDNFIEGIKYVSQKTYNDFKDYPSEALDYKSIVNFFSIAAEEHYHVVHSTNETLRTTALKNISSTIVEIQDNAHGVLKGHRDFSESLSPNVDKHFLDQLINTLRHSFNTISKLK